MMDPVERHDGVLGRVAFVLLPPGMQEAIDA
jgi:hypothetical protein